MLWQVAGIQRHGGIDVAHDEDSVEVDGQHADEARGRGVTPPEAVMVFVVCYVTATLGLELATPVWEWLFWPAVLLGLLVEGVRRVSAKPRPLPMFFGAPLVLTVVVVLLQRA